MEHVLGLEAESAIRVSAKTGLGIDELLSAILSRIPPPKGDKQAPNDTYRPGGVQMLSVTAGILDERGHDSQVRQAAHQHHRSHPDRHQPEILRQENARQDQEPEQKDEFLARQRQAAPNDRATRPLCQISRHKPTRLFPRVILRSLRRYVFPEFARQSCSSESIPSHHKRTPRTETWRLKAFTLSITVVFAAVVV